MYIRVCICIYIQGLGTGGFEGFGEALGAGDAERVFSTGPNRNF